ncbi:winged helix-turn-helix domain-containing protein [Serratia fonticola]|uniref:winged helix-turn-helix domain-containing protein n=1 Tax=Serratia fonticola TaxID=47917 RepID=UPI001AEA5F9D|nr:helix-turn-helix domain-containing protein [Serratia fonticola]MBP0998929.1 winged helix-turn-helix domain-containing protein [Serratia fonticola]MBP1002286.1 winged helix-turn-helix domain-containing protein [Serratia fonticola]MBP1012243.1 winged helix-turn-helix domain-containing protein [Serratia fonticola]
MEDNLHGFLIDEAIYFNVNHRRLMYFINEDEERPLSFRLVLLNEMQTRLLAFLLKNRRIEVISKNNIMRNVWDEFGLSSSNQRLWQEIKKLKSKLLSIGLRDNLIINVRGIGYSVDNERVKSLIIE